VIKLLLDEHISPDVAIGLRRRNSAMVVWPLREWEGGNFLGADDGVCPGAAAAQGLTFVTYDRRTIAPLLKVWMEEGRHHAGVVFVDEKTISPANIGRLVRALQELAKLAADWDWTDRIVFLRK
jgi:hypothetical protein